MDIRLVLVTATVVPLLALVQGVMGSVQLHLSLVNTPNGSILAPGDSATVVVSAAAGGDTFNSAIFRMVWSRPGVTLTAYQWGSPFVTGGVFDDSMPPINALPITVTDGLLSGFGYDPDVADVEFSNVVPPPSPPGGPGTFASGELLRLTFSIPFGFDEGGLLLRLEPDTFAQGIVAREVDPVLGLFFIVVPTPASVGIGMLALVKLTIRRRRDEE